MADPSLRFDDYWSVFVRAHKSPLVRRVHVVSTTVGLGCVVVGAVTRRPSLVLGGALVALAPTWLARRLTGGVSLPLSLPRHGAYYLAASLRMWALTVAGAMDAELDRVPRSSPDASTDLADEDAPHPPPNMVTDHTLH